MPWLGWRTVGTPVGAGANGTSIGVTMPSITGGMVLDVLYGQNSTTGYTAGVGQTEHWDTNTTGGLDNLRGTGSSEVGAPSVAMTWTAGAGTNMALMAVAFSPDAPPAPTAPAAPTLTSATPATGRVALAWTTPADGGSAITGYEVWRSTTVGGEAFHVAPVGLGTTYTDTTNVTNGTTYYYQVQAVNAWSRPALERAECDAHRTPRPDPAGGPDPDQRHAGNGRWPWPGPPRPMAAARSPATRCGAARPSGSEAFHVAPVGLGTTYTDTTNVTNGTTYYYQVKAVNAWPRPALERAVGDAHRTRRRS